MNNFHILLPALIIIGTEYVRKSSGVDTGLSDLVDRVGVQTGLYGGRQVESKSRKSVKERERDKEEREGERQREREEDRGCTTGRKR